MHRVSGIRDSPFSLQSSPRADTSLSPPPELVIPPVFTSTPYVASPLLSFPRSLLSYTVRNRSFRRSPFACVASLGSVLFVNPVGEALRASLACFRSAEGHGPDDDEDVEEDEGN